MNKPDPEGLLALKEFYVVPLVAAKFDDSHPDVRRPPSYNLLISHRTRAKVWHWPYTPLRMLEEEYQTLQDELFYLLAED